MRDLYHAFNDGRRGKPPYCIELWSLHEKYGEYVSDTFYWGPLYSKAR
jgi:hypothetical protein